MPCRNPVDSIFKRTEDRKIIGKALAEANRSSLIQRVRARDRFQATPFMRNMIRALEIHPWQNTVDDWQRYYEAKIILSARRARR